MNGLIDRLVGRGGTANGDGYRAEPVALLENDTILKADLKIWIFWVCSRYIILVQNPSRDSSGTGGTDAEGEKRLKLEA